MNPRIALPPGRYQLRVGVRESGAGEMGTVFYDLQVPDYSANGLAMSGLLADRSDAPASSLRAQPDDQLAAGIAARAGDQPPDVQSERRPERVRRNLRQRPSRDARRIEVMTTLTGEDGVAAFSSRESSPAGAARARREKLADSHASRSAQGRAAGPLRAACGSAALGGGRQPVVA